MEIRKYLAISIAKSIISKNNYSVPIDPFNYCSKILGFEVLKVPMDTSISAIMIRSQKMIGVNETTHPNRQRFSVAHEIGHFHLHENIFEFKDTETSFKDLRTPMEAEANIFAAEFLMPSEIVKHEFSKCANCKALANFFKVSDTAMFYRLIELKLIKI